MTPSIANQAFVEPLGWVLLHTIWQFTLVGAVAYLLLGVLQRGTPSTRYRALSAILLAAVAIPILTWAFVSQADSRNTNSTTLATTDIRTRIQGAQPSVKLSGSESPPLFSTRENGVHRQASLQQSLDPVAQDLNVDGDVDAGTDEKAASRAAPIVWIDHWQPTVVVLWFVGALLFSLRPMIGWSTVRRLCRRDVFPVTDEWLQRAGQLSAQLGVKRRVALLLSQRVHMPMVVGWLRPTILLPLGMVSQMPVSQIEAILAHELAHVRRLDYLVNFGQTVLEAIFFYHPMIWWLSHRIRVEREHCCDDMAVQTFHNRKTYGEALLFLAEMPVAPAAAVTTVAANGGSLLQRIRRLSGEPPAGPPVSGMVAVALAVAVGLIVFQSPLGADENKEPSGKRTVHIKLMLPNASKDSNGFRIDLPIVGFPDSNEAHRSILADASGGATVADLANGEHPFFVTSKGASGFWSHRGVVSIPADQTSQTFDFRNTPASRPGPLQFSITNRDNDFEVRSRMTLKVTNPTNAIQKVGDLEICLVSNEWRVFLPADFGALGKGVEPQQEITATLDWPTLVTRGLWLSRSAELITEPAIPDEAGSMGFRLNNNGPGIQLKHPALVLQTLEAMSKAKAAIVLPKRVFYVGEPIPAKYMIHNRSEQSIRVEWGGDSRAPRQLRFKIVATRNGKRVADPFPQPWCFGGMAGVKTIKPGEQHPFSTISLQSYATFDRPGKYRVRAYHDLGWEGYEQWSDQAPVPLLENRLPQGAPRAPLTKEVMLEIREPNPAEAKATIQSLREQFESSNAPQDLFLNLRHNAYLPTLLAWIDENGGTIGAASVRRHEFVYGRTAIVGIGGILTPEATKALIRLAQHEDGDIARDSLHQLIRRLPNPYFAKQPHWNTIPPAFNGSWDPRYRKEVLELGFSLLKSAHVPLPKTHKEFDDPQENRRQARILAARLLQSTVSRRDYDRLRSVAIQVIRQHRDDVQEQAYPRPLTVGQTMIQTLWLAFGDGKFLDKDEAVAKTFEAAKLEASFQRGELDPFTAAKLMQHMPDFRPHNWMPWINEQLRSDEPWVRCHTLEHLPEVRQEFREGIRRNLAAYRPALQAAALTIAGEHPSADYISTLEQAAKKEREWLQPMAQRALEACRQGKNGGKRHPGNSGEKRSP